MAALTEMQRDFCVQVAVHGHCQTEAARLAGYAHPGRNAHALMHDARIRNAIRVLREHYIEGDLASLAFATIRKCMSDETAPWNVRFAAAKYVADIAGFGKEGDDKGQEKNLSEMSTDELAEFVRRGKDALDSRLENMPKVAPVLTLNAQDNAQG